jgi:predicted transcriptional regulator
MVMVTASVRLEGEIAARLDRIAQKSSERAGGAEISRSSAIRMAIERGIADLEKELGIKHSPKPRSRE